MDVLHLLGTLRERGATLQLDDNGLRVTPARVLDDALRGAIRCHKSELLHLLSLETASSSTQSEAAWKREEAKSALDLLREEAALCAVPFQPRLVRVTSRLCELWRAAEAETGEALTISGHPRASGSLTSIPTVTGEVNQ